MSAGILWALRCLSIDRPVLHHSISLCLTNAFYRLKWDCRAFSLENFIEVLNEMWSVLFDPLCYFDNRNTKQSFKFQYKYTKWNFIMGIDWWPSPSWKILPARAKRKKEKTETSRTIDSNRNLIKLCGKCAILASGVDFILSNRSLLLKWCTTILFLLALTIHFEIGEKLNTKKGARIKQRMLLAEREKNKAEKQRAITGEWFVNRLKCAGHSQLIKSDLFDSRLDFFFSSLCWWISVWV